MAYLIGTAGGVVVIDLDFYYRDRGGVSHCHVGEVSLPSATVTVEGPCLP
jgi:hypothetical protein